MSLRHHVATHRMISIHTSIIAEIVCTKISSFIEVSLMSNRSRFRFARIQTSHGRHTICGFVYSEFAQIVFGEQQLHCDVVEKRFTSLRRIQSGPSILRIKLPERKYPVAGL